MLKTIFAGVFTGLMLAWAYPAGADVDHDPDVRCFYVNLDRITSETVMETSRVLREEYGFYGVAGDGMEALYSRGCLTPGSAI